MSVYLLPIFIAFTFIYAKIKNVNVYNSFIVGAKQSVPLVPSVPERNGTGRCPQAPAHQR